jgi:hypothetical protein
MDLTEEQQSHIDWILVKIGLNVRIQATIKGAAGTGKTVTVNELKKHLKGKVQCIAYTHTAANLIGGKTIHSYFSMTPIDPDAPVIEFSNHLKTSSIPTTLILDECSMVDDDLLSQIILFCKDNDVNFICVGDEYQLPPINNGGMNKCFDSSHFEQLELTKILRQGAGSTIIQLSSLFRQYDFIPNFAELDPTLLQPEVRFDLYNHKNWIDHWNEDTTILGYSNKVVQAVNSKIVNAYYDDGELFHIGSRIVLKAPFWYKKTGDFFAQIPNGTEITLSTCLPDTKVVTAIDKKKHLLRGYRVEFVMVEMPDTVTKFLIHYDDIDSLDKLKKDYRLAWKKSKKDTDIKDQWALSGLKNIIVAYHHYASTIHLSQGKTHEQTILMVPSLYGLQVNNKVEEYNRLAYVSCSRPRSQLILTGAIWK